MPKKLFVGRGATEKCREDIAQCINLTHPDFICLTLPSDISALDIWVAKMSESPIAHKYRCGLIEDAHLLSDVAFGRLLDLLESSGSAHIWISSQSIPPDTICSRVEVCCVGQSDDKSEWRNLLENCANNLVGSSSSELWDEWYKVSKLYRLSINGLHERKCIEQACCYKITQGCKRGR
jgi:hypothetical protein